MATKDLKASNSNVVQQARLLDSAGTAWHAVKYGNLEMITKLFPSQCNVYNKGPVGENVFHVAMLLNTPSTLAIAKYLVKLYGKTLVNTPYQERKCVDDPPGLYEGETAVHIAIVNHDFDMVKFLIQAGADVRARAYGGFFQLGSAVYYGEYPLSFAACTGQKDIVSYLKRHGARVNQDKDMFGNTALHLCVFHDQLDMYDHLVEYCGASEHVRNNRGMTPLLVAASLGKTEFYQHIYNKRRKVAWAYGPVTSYSLALHEIDTVQNSKTMFIPSAVEMILRKGHTDILNDPMVKTLCTAKWQRFALFQFVVQGVSYLIYVVLQTFLVWQHCSPQYWNSKSRWVLEIVNIILAGLFCLLDILDVYVWTLGVYQRRRLMMANYQYKPTLYVIPGEVAEEPSPKHMTLSLGGMKGWFIKRFGGKKAAGAVSEGVERERDEEAGVPSTAHQWHQQMGRLAAARATAKRRGIKVTLPGAVNVSSGENSPEAQFRPWDPDMDAAGTAAGPSSAAQTEAATVSESQQWPSCCAIQLATARCTTSSSGSSSRAVAEAHEPAPPRGVQFSNTDQGVASMLQQSPSMKYSDLGGGALPPVDIVSVGLTPPSNITMQSPSFLAQPMAPSFLSPQVTSMLVPQGNQSASQHNLLGIDPVPGRRGPMHADTGISNFPGPALSGVDERSSIADDDCSMPPPRESMEFGGEIKNRLRGGGGADLAAGGKSVRRVDTKKNSAGEDKDVPDQEDEREPLHLGGFRGNLATLGHSLAGYYWRQLKDPTTLLMTSHQLLTCIHFITWASTYGGVTGRKGSGPRDKRVNEFDDIIVSIMALAGWTSLLYFTRGVQYLGQFEVILERCFLQVIKYFLVYLVFNIGYSLAFYAVLNGTTYAQDPSESVGMLNIGWSMIQVLRFEYGEAEYTTFTDTPFQSKHAVATVYFIFYIGTVLMLLTNLLTAMVMHYYNGMHDHAVKIWYLRWASYVLRAEGRMPLWLQQRFRLGEVAYDPHLQMRVYNHVFEVVEDQKVSDKQRQANIVALEAMLEELKKQSK